MDSEIQRRKTFEVIAKWIAKQAGVTIEFQHGAVPNADPKTKRIVLPTNLKIENLDKVLALVFHEAAHIKFSTFDMKKLIDNQNDKNILNAAEDVRVDKLNIAYLPRINEFYEELIKWEDAQGKGLDKVPKPVRALLSAMRKCTGFHQYADSDKEVIDFICKHRIDVQLEDINSYLHQIQNGKPCYPEAKKRIKKLSELIFGKSSNTKPEGIGTGGMGQGKHAALFEIDPQAKYALSEVSLQEQTVQAFQELLLNKSKRIIHDGTILDVNNLTAFFTGDVDELFKEIKIEKYKKSKIIFLLDSSGSMMSHNDCDKHYKNHTLVEVCKRLVRILREVQEQEGINVDFDVRGFDTDYYVWRKDEWEHAYMHCGGGGTYCLMAFEKAQEEMLKDPTVDGNKMIVLITDGQVSESEIIEIKNRIIKHSSDIKCLIMGIGLNKQFEQICGGRNIIARDLADGVILQAIEDLLNV